MLFENISKLTQNRKHFKKKTKQKNLLWVLSIIYMKCRDVFKLFYENSYRVNTDTSKYYCNYYMVLTRQRKQTKLSDQCSCMSKIAIAKTICTILAIHFATQWSRKLNYIPYKIKPFLWYIEVTDIQADTDKPNLLINAFARVERSKTNFHGQYLVLMTN